MILLLMGPPGAGKGTQAALLAENLGMCKLSTGDMFRTICKDPQTPIEREIKETIDSGALVPDDLTIKLLEEELAKPKCANGVILDGFPRTVPQAEVLDGMLAQHDMKIDHIIALSVNEAELVARKAGRLYAPTSQRVYHIEYDPPQVAGKCDVTGEDLVQREDDKPEVVQKRLDVYREQTAPVLGYYEAQNRLQTVDGMGTVAEVQNALKKVLQ